MELRPGAAGTATVTTLLSGLTNPQGLAFASLDGRRVLYVADRTRSTATRGGRRDQRERTVIAGGLPDADPTATTCTGRRT